MPLDKSYFSKKTKPELIQIITKLIDLIEAGGIQYDPSKNIEYREGDFFESVPSFDMVLPNYIYINFPCHKLSIWYCTPNKNFEMNFTEFANDWGDVTDNYNFVVTPETDFSNIVNRILKN